MIFHDNFPTLYHDGNNLNFLKTGTKKKKKQQQQEEEDKS